MARFPLFLCVPLFGPMENVMAQGQMKNTSKMGLIVNRVAHASTAARRYTMFANKASHLTSIIHT